MGYPSMLDVLKAVGLKYFRDGQRPSLEDHNSPQAPYGAEYRTIFGKRLDKPVDISGKPENIVYLELVSGGYIVFIGKF
jgi:hypothetical protein